MSPDMYELLLVPQWDDDEWQMKLHMAMRGEIEARADIVNQVRNRDAIVVLCAHDCRIIFPGGGRRFWWSAPDGVAVDTGKVDELHFEPPRQWLPRVSWSFAQDALNIGTCKADAFDRVVARYRSSVLTRVDAVRTVAGPEAELWVVLPEDVKSKLWCEPEDFFPWRFEIKRRVTVVAMGPEA